MARPSEKDNAVLRLLTVLSFIPALPLCIAHGAISNHACPATGLIPLAASAVLGLVRLLQPAPRIHLGSKHASRDLSVFVVFAADLTLAISLLAVLIATWVYLSRYKHGNVVGTYATVPLLLNFCIHAYFVLRTLYTALSVDDLLRALLKKSEGCRDCPHCRNNPEASTRDVGEAMVSSISRAVYTPLTSVDYHDGDDTSAEQESRSPPATLPV